MEPGHFFAVFNRAYLLERLGELPEALAGFTAAADLAPADWAPPFNAGIVLLRMGRPVDAAEALSESAERAGDPIAEVLYARSIARRQAGDFAGAAHDAKAFRAKALDLPGVAEDASVTVEEIVAKARRDKAHADVSGAAMEWAASRSDPRKAATASRGKGLRATIDTATREGLHQRLGQGAGGQAFRNMVASSEAAQPHAALLGRLGQSVALETVRTERLRVKRSVDKYAIETAHTDYDRRRVRQLAAAAREYRPPLPDGRDEHRSPAAAGPADRGRLRKAAKRSRPGHAAASADAQRSARAAAPHAPPAVPVAVSAAAVLPRRPNRPASALLESPAPPAERSGSGRPGSAWARAGSNVAEALRPATVGRGRRAGSLLGRWGIATTFRPETAAAMGFRGALSAAAVAGADSDAQLCHRADPAGPGGLPAAAAFTAKSHRGDAPADDPASQASTAQRPRPSRPASGLARPSAPRPARQRPSSGVAPQERKSVPRPERELAPVAVASASAAPSGPDASARSPQQRTPAASSVKPARDSAPAAAAAAPSTGRAGRPAAKAQPRAAASAYASGRVFAPSAIRPNELTATTASLIARCMRLLPHDPLRQDRKRLRLQRRQEAMKKARAAVRTAREGGNEQDVQAAIEAVASDARPDAGAAGGGGPGSGPAGADLGSPESPHAAPEPASSRPAAVPRDRRRSAVERDLPQAVASRLGVRKEQGFSFGGESSRGKPAAEFSEQDIEFLVSLTRGVKVFASLPLHVHQRLCRELRFLVVPARKVIYKQGKSSDDRLFIIIQGSVDVHMRLGTARKTRNRRIRTAILAHRWVKAFRSRALARDRGEAVPMPLASMIGPGEGLRVWAEGRGAAKGPNRAQGDGGILPAWAGTMMQAAKGRWDTPSQADGLGADEVRSARARVERLRTETSKAQEPSPVMLATAAVAGGAHTAPADQLTGMLGAGSGGRPLWLDFLSDDEEDGSDVDDGDSGLHQSALRPLRGGGTASGAPQSASAGTSGHVSALGTLLGSLYAGEAFGGEVLVGIGHSSSQGPQAADETLANARDSDARSAEAAAKTRRDSAFGALGGRIGVEFKDFHRTVMPPAAAARAAANRDAVEQESGKLNARRALLAQAQASAALDAAAEGGVAAPTVGPSGLAMAQGVPPRFRRVSVSTREDSCILTLSREAYQSVLEEVREAMVADVSRFLAKVSLFEQLTKEELRRLAERIEHRRLRSGQNVVSQGDRVQGLFFLRAGRCSVRQVVSKAPTGAAKASGGDLGTGGAVPLEPTPAGVGSRSEPAQPGRPGPEGPMREASSTDAGAACAGSGYVDSDSDSGSTRSYRTEAESLTRKRRKQSFQSSQRFSEVLDHGMAESPRRSSPSSSGASAHGFPTSPVRALRPQRSPGSTRRHSSSGLSPDRTEGSGVPSRGRSARAPAGRRGQVPPAPTRPAAAPRSPHRLQTRVAPWRRRSGVEGAPGPEPGNGARVPFARADASGPPAGQNAPGPPPRPAAGSPRPRPRALSVDTGGSRVRLQAGGDSGAEAGRAAADTAARAGDLPASGDANSTGSVPTSSIQRRSNRHGSLKHENPQTARAAALRRQRAEEEEFAVVQSQLAASLPIDALMPVSTGRARDGARVLPGSGSVFAFGDDAQSVRSGAEGGVDLAPHAPMVLQSGVGARSSSRHMRPSSATTQGLGAAARGDVPATPSSAISAVPLGVRVQAAMLARERRWKAVSRVSRYGGVRSRPAEHVGPSPHGGHGDHKSPSDGTGSELGPAADKTDAALPGATAMIASQGGGGAGPLVHMDREEFDSHGAGRQRRGSNALGRTGQARPDASGAGRCAADTAEPSQAAAHAAACTDGDEGTDVLELGTLMPGDCFGESVALSTRPSLLDKSNRALLQRHALSLVESGVALGHLPRGHPLFGMSLPEVRTLAAAPQEPHGLPSDIVDETRAPASVLCETAVEVLLLKRKDLYDCLSFQSRQKVREAAMVAPANRSVTTSGQRLAWQRFREQVAAEARTGSAAAGRHAQLLRRAR